MKLQVSLRGRTLPELITELKEGVRRAPADPSARAALLQAYAIVGDHERALGQVEVLESLEDRSAGTAAFYRPLLSAEAARSEVLAARAAPRILGEPPAWTAYLAEALKATAAGDLERANGLQVLALEEAPGTPGVLTVVLPGDAAAPGSATTSRAFEWIADGDSRLGPVLEAYIEGRYFWIPFEHVRRMVLEAPRTLRDLAWAPVHFEWTNGGRTPGLIPARYPESEHDPDDDVRLARVTRWEQRADRVYVGAGQRVFVSDAGEFPLLDLRSFELRTEQETGLPRDEA